MLERIFLWSLDTCNAECHQLWCSMWYLLRRQCWLLLQSLDMEWQWHQPHSNRSWVQRFPICFCDPSLVLLGWASKFSAIILSKVPISLRTKRFDPYTKLPQFGVAKVLYLFMTTSNDEPTRYAMSNDSRHIPLDIWWSCIPRWMQALDISLDVEWT